MAFKDFPAQKSAVELLQRSLKRGRLAHAYLFCGHQLEELENQAATLAKVLNCQNPVRSGGPAIDCCDRCLACQKIAHGNHADVHWVRPESKSRVITTAQMRELMREIQLKPTEAEFKVAIVVAADRLRVEAANAFLKTLEEPPPKSILILLTTEPQRILETILSRCLRLNFGGAGPRPLDPGEMAWLTTFCQMAANEQKSLLGRYRLMDVLVRRLTEMKETIQKSLTARSPLERYPDAEKGLIEKWEDELTAAIEAEYRRQRSDLMRVLQWWLRDVWLQTLAARDFETKDNRNETAEKKTQRESRLDGLSEPESGKGQSLLNFPQIKESSRVASRISAGEALENLEVIEQLQSWLHTNVQEALALEVGLLKLRL